MTEPTFPLPADYASGVSEQATELLRELCRRANREGHTWIHRNGIAAMTGCLPSKASAILQELIAHKDVLLDTERDGGWVLTVLRECEPG